MQPQHRSLSFLAVALALLPCAAAATERLRVEPGTKIPVRLERAVGTKDFYQWKSFGEVRTVPATLMQDILTADGQVALPAGTHISVAVLETKRAGHVEGRSRLRLGLYSVLTPDGERIPLDGYPTKLVKHKTDSEGTAHGNRGLVKDAGVDFSSVAVGAGAGFLAFGPPGAVVGAGGGLLVAAIWTVARRGPDLMVPAGTVVDFTLGRPASFMASGEYEEDGPGVHPSQWSAPQPQSQWSQPHWTPPRWATYQPSAAYPANPGYNQGYQPYRPAPAVVPVGNMPSEDLLEMSEQVTTNPNGVLKQLKSINFKDRSPVDRTFGKYVQALAKFQGGDHGSEPLNLMREAYMDAQRTNLPGAARDEMARNLVVIMRASEKNWERDPLLNDPQVQAALVEVVQ